MKRKEDLARSVGRKSVVIIFCSALVGSVAAFDGGASRLSLQIVGDSVTADIENERLAKVAHKLEMNTNATVDFKVPQVEAQRITVQFENFSLEAALKAILKRTNYAIVAKPAEQGAEIHAYVYSELSEDASAHKPTYHPETSKRVLNSDGPDPTETPLSPDETDPDPAVRARNLEAIVASAGPQSLALVLAAAQDPNTLVRSTSVKLLLGELRDLVPRADLATIAQRSKDPDIRLEALEALAEREDWLDHARMTLDGALHDTEPRVKQRAEELLQDLPKLEPHATP